jgi:hypothetical protein
VLIFYFRSAPNRLLFEMLAYATGLRRAAGNPVVYMEARTPMPDFGFEVGFLPQLIYDPVGGREPILCR